MTNKLRFGLDKVGEKYYNNSNTQEVGLMRNRKRSITKPKLIYFEPRMVTLLEDIARESAVTLNAIVKIACREWLQRNVKQPPLSVETPKETVKEEPRIRFADDD